MGILFEKIVLYMDRFLLGIGGVSVILIMSLASVNIVMRIFAEPMRGAYTGAVSVASALGFAQRKKITWKGFSASIIDTLRLPTIIFMIIAGATIFGRFLALTRLPYEAAGVISSFDAPRPLLLALAFLLISLPIFFPLVSAMGYDPIWFGQVITIITTMGSIMPRSEYAVTWCTVWQRTFR